ncbi:MAG: site-2 protease family protein [Clostridia bacterium]|nr:site-2 protease family protein [Clostridia bacterium]
MILSLLYNLNTKEGVIITLTTLLLRIPAVLLALSVHEAAHGWVANKCGDPTAKNLGRITINPIKHLDPIGAVSMLLFGIGWAKPVPVNSRYFKKPKRDMALTAAAGPVSNVLQGVVGMFILFISTKILLADLGATTPEAFGNYGGMYGLIFVLIFEYAIKYKVIAILLFFLLIYATLNFSLALFNLIPIPPFDGSRILFVFLPDKYYFGIMKYERIIMIVFLVLFFGASRLGLFDDIFMAFINLVFKAFAWIL